MRQEFYFYQDKWCMKVLVKHESLENRILN